MRLNMRMKREMWAFLVNFERSALFCTLWPFSPSRFLRASPHLAPRCSFDNYGYDDREAINKDHLDQYTNNGKRAVAVTT